MHAPTSQLVPFIASSMYRRRLKSKLAMPVILASPRTVACGRVPHIYPFTPAARAFHQRNRSAPAGVSLRATAKSATRREIAAARLRLRSRADTSLAVDSENRTLPYEGRRTSPPVFGTRGRFANHAGELMRQFCAAATDFICLSERDRARHRWRLRRLLTQDDQRARRHQKGDGGIGTHVRCAPRRRGIVKSR